ncbi:MAG TPA: NAD(P)/FAD-dependent oxidoreductase, partial [Nitrospirae bacterium]|nr:NAD(P)/FAD-dependent oxidoreductase [Nitrospirota bacterium]
MSEFDLAVLGGGPGGYSAAFRAVSSGLKVALIEKGELGGTCLNRGCVPTKTWVAVAETVDHAKLMSSLSKEPFEYSVDYKKMRARQIKIVFNFRKSLEALLRKRGVEIFEGKGKFVTPNRISVNTGSGTDEIKFKHAVIATGAAPLSPFDLDSHLVLTSASVFELESLPESIIIIGGGSIGCEIACVLSRLGVRVTMVASRARVLPREDEDVSSQIAREMKKQKIKLVTGTRIESLSIKNGEVEARVADGKTYSAEKVLVSIGRVYNTSSIGLKEAGVDIGPKGEILTDDFMRTSADHIYAVGDVAGKNMLAYTAYKEGALAAYLCAGNQIEPAKMIIPTAIFTIPEIGSVGVTSKEAPDSAKTGLFNFRSLARAHSTDETAGFVKVIADGQSDRI